MLVYCNNVKPTRGMTLAKLRFVGLIASSVVFCNLALAETKSNFGYERHMKGATLVELIGEGIPTTGEPANIIKKAQSCVARYVTNGPVSSSGALNLIAGRANTANGGANMIEMADPDGGQLVFNAQVAFSYMWVGRIARAKIIVEAKTDRFRLLITSPTVLYSDKSSDASDLVVAAGTGGEQAIEALRTTANKVSTCVLEDTKKDW